jgi:MFS family permease
LRELLKVKGIWGLILVTGLSDMGLSSVTYFLPLYLISAPGEGGLGKDALTVGFFLAGAQVAGIIAQPVMGWLSDMYGRKIVLLPAMTFLGILFIGLYFAADGYLLVLNVFAMGAFLYSLHTVFIAAAMDVSGGKSQATVVSLIYSASLLGTASPIFTGLLIDEFGLKSAFLFSGIISLLATILLFSLKLPMSVDITD